MPIILLVILFCLTVFSSAKETMVGRGYECNTLVENAGSVRLINFSYPNVEVEVTINSYIGSSFLGFFHPMKLMTENLAAEIKIETQKFTNPRTGEEIVDEVYIHGPDHLNLILDKYYNYGGYPRTERFNFQVGPYNYKINFFLSSKTFWNIFGSECVQANLGVIELNATQGTGSEEELNAITKTCADYDFNCDGKTTNADLDVIAKYWQNGTQITMNVVTGAKCEPLVNFLAPYWQQNLNGGQVAMNDITLAGKEISKCLPTQDVAE